MTRLVEILPFSPRPDESKEIWKPYLPHATHLVNLFELYDEQVRVSLLYRVAFCSFRLARMWAGLKAFRELIDRGSHAPRLKNLGDLPELRKVREKYGLRVVSASEREEEKRFVEQLGEMIATIEET